MALLVHELLKLLIVILLIAATVWAPLSISILTPVKANLRESIQHSENQTGKRCLYGRQLIHIS